MKKLVLNLILILVISMQYANATTYYINHNGPMSTITYQPGDVLEFYSSMDGEYTANTTNGSIVPFTFFNASTLVGTYTLTGNETMASITLRIPTGMPPPSQPYTFLPTIITLVESCNVIIPDVNFKAYLVGNTLINTNGDSEIQCTEASAFTGSIYCPSLGITDLTSIEAFTNCSVLYCNDNALTSLDLSSNLSLIQIVCANNQLTSLNLGTNSVCTYLVCSYNNIASLDISYCDGLTTFSCEDNQIPNLDFANKTNLTVLQCGINNLTSLDVTDCVNLTHLTCYENNITSLDVSQNTELVELRSASNPISSLDVGMLTQLNYFFCGTSNLSSIDVTNNTELWQFDCSSTNISSIDLSNNTLLNQFGATYTDITLLDLSNNSLLEQLAIHHGIFEEVNLQNGNNTIITYAAFMNNPNLICVQVDDVAYSTANWTNKDAGLIYSLDCSAINGVEEEALNTVNIYPNPSKGNVTIQANFPTEISLVDLNGTVLFKTNLIGSIQVDLSEFATGIYFIQTTEGETLKLIKE